MKNYKRLFKFLKGKYHYLVISLLMVLIIQLLGFVTPLMVKVVLDDCLLGIEYDYVEVSNDSIKTISYNNHYYKQKRYLTEDDFVISNADVVIYKSGYYFVDLGKTDLSIIDIDTKKIVSIDGTNYLEITSGDDVTYYDAYHLSTTEVFAFYKPIIPTLRLYIILLFVKTIIVIICGFIKAYTVNKVINYLANEGRTRALKNAEFLPISFYEEEPAGKMASRITKDVDGLIVMYQQIINLFASAILSFIFAYIGMFILNYKLSLITFIFYPFIIIWIKLFIKRLHKIAVKSNESRSMLTAKINEIINGIQILQIFNFKKQTVSEFNVINDEFKKEQLNDVKLSVTLGWNMINIIKAAITTFVVVYFSLQYIHVKGIVITAGLIYAYNEYLLKIVEPINIIFTQISTFEDAHVKIDRIHKLIEGKTEDATVYDVDRYKGNIVFDNIWFSYDKKEYALKGVSMKINAGEFIGIVGHTGSGKSSMMNLLLRFYDITDPLSGNIYVDGMPINSIPKRAYRKHIAIVLQDPVMFKGDIASNITYGLDNISEEDVMNVLIKMGGDKIISKYPKGLHQEVLRNGTNLSAGEKQIISLARAIIHNPAILIMDEATSHIDTETENIIKQSINVASLNRTVIVIAHRLSTIYNADKIFVLDHGLMAESGTHSELVAKNGVYANIYRSQVQNIKNI